ncbi:MULTISPECIES: hypothetical protein [Paenibacillus]|uniref:Uncharacterized protein n=1 Tax=Paenibacillus borealis TaxID=160799 RepID=A0ABX3HLT5_PAEBO|nr:hypothetical protein [Paenibacillus borealis]OMD50743.1 hypothetical protein BSK56_06135 [Paenibacillus borealis]
MTQVPKKTKTYQNSQSISGIFREITGLTLIGKTAPLEPDPHILHDDDQNLDLARLDGHEITIWEDGTCESSFKVTSLGAEPEGIYSATLVYHFLDSANREIGKWNEGIFPVSCGTMNEPRNPRGSYDGSLYDRIAHVECPVEGTWVWCASDDDGIK